MGNIASGNPLPASDRAVEDDREPVLAVGDWFLRTFTKSNSKTRLASGGIEGGLPRLP